MHTDTMQTIPTGGGGGGGGGTSRLPGTTFYRNSNKNLATGGLKGEHRRVKMESDENKYAGEQHSLVLVSD